MPILGYLMHNFHYYDKPEGKDPIGKVLGCAKIGIFSGTFISVYDAILYSKCQNAPQFLNTAGYWMIPLTGMGVSFSTVAYTMCKLRGKDDKLNYVAGVLAAGGVLHAWQKDIFISGWGTALLMAYALLKKAAIQRGESKNLFIPETIAPKEYSTWRTIDYRNYNPAPKWEHKRDYY